MRAVILSHVYLDPDRRGKLRALAGMGIGLAAAVPGGAPGEDHGVRIVPIPIRGDLADPLSCTWNRNSLRALLTDHRPDILQLEEEPWSLASDRAAAEATRLKIPVVLWSQELKPPPGFRTRRRERRVLKRAGGGIAGNAVALQRLREGLPTTPVISLPQFGIALPPFFEREPRDLLAIGYVGRLLKDRGVDRLLRACASLMGGWNLTVAGTGPEQESLELLAQRLGLASRVRWLGGITEEEVDRLWSELDCLVLPAGPDARGADRWSSILVEAMARGVIPVVMEGGIPASVVGAAGKIARDDEALATLLQTLRAYPGDRVKLAGRARQRVLDHFVDSALAKQTVQLWEEILQRS